MKSKKDKQIEDLNWDNIEEIKLSHIVFFMIALIVFGCLVIWSFVK